MWKWEDGRRVKLTEEEQIYIMDCQKRAGPGGLLLMVLPSRSTRKAFSRRTGLRLLSSKCLGLLPHEPLFLGDGLGLHYRASTLALELRLTQCPSRCRCRCGPYRPETVPNDPNVTAASSRLW